MCLIAKVKRLGKHFFFIKHDDPRRNAWLKAIGREDDGLKELAICEDSTTHKKLMSGKLEESARTNPLMAVKI